MKWFQEWKVFLKFIIDKVIQRIRVRLFNIKVVVIKFFDRNLANSTRLRYIINLENVNFRKNWDFLS